MKILFTLILLLGCLAPSRAVSYDNLPDSHNELEETMVPIPIEDRVFNRTGIQCVWASVECLGRYADEPKLIGLTDHPDCKSYASPSSLAVKLKKLDVKFEQTTNRLDKSLIFKSVVKDRRGCLFAIPGHAMTLVHYDEVGGIVKYINNSDKSLKIRTWTLKEFNQRWDGWICVVYPDLDFVYKKYTKSYPIPILDRNEAQGSYEYDYVLYPSLRF